MVRRGKVYLLTEAVKTKLIKKQHSEELLCFKCEQPLEVGKPIRSTGTGAARWYHPECFEKTRIG